MDLNKIDLNNVPKQLVDKHVLGFGKDHFVIGMMTGGNLTTFALGRTNGKEFLQNLTKLIEESEKRFGEITVNSGIASPIQFPSVDGK